MELNFPPLYQYFELYKTMPLILNWALEEEQQTLGVPPRSLIFQKIRGKAGSENNVVHCGKQVIERNALELCQWSNNLAHPQNGIGGEIASCIKQPLS